MAGKIPTTVITGFLGAGKTTMIQHILENPGGRRIALIVNEFGDLGVDGEILRGCGVDSCASGGMIELSNGCICCTVAEEFTPAIQSLIERPDQPDHILIETSGLALPQPLVRAFNWPEIRGRVTVDSVITMVDGPALRDGLFAHDTAAIDRLRESDDKLDHETPLSELFEDQLACADLVLVNKTDMLGQDKTIAIKRDLRKKVRHGVWVLTTNFGAIDPGMILGVEMGAEGDMDARRELHHGNGADGDDHDHDEFVSFTVDLPEIKNTDRLMSGIRQAISSSGIFRIKGFAAVEGRPFRLVVQAVGQRAESYFDRRFKENESRISKLVMIGEHGIDFESIAKTILDASD